MPTYPVAQIMTSTSCSTPSSFMTPVGVIFLMPWEKVVTLGRVRASRNPFPGFVQMLEIDVFRGSKRQLTVGLLQPTLNVVGINFSARSVRPLSLFAISSAAN